jgi:hypothetical protein
MYQAYWWNGNMRSCQFLTNKISFLSFQILDLLFPHNAKWGHNEGERVNKKQKNKAKDPRLVGAQLGHSPLLGLYSSVDPWVILPALASWLSISGKFELITKWWMLPNFFQLSKWSCRNLGDNESLGKWKSHKEDLREVWPILALWLWQVILASLNHS